MPMDTNRNGATVAGVLVPLIPAALFYAIVLLCLSEVHVTQYGGGGGEARLSEGLTQLWLTVSGVMLWVMLGLQLWFTRNAAAVPVWVGKAVLPLYLLSAAASAFAIGAMFQSVGGRSWVVPVLLPPLLSLYAAWAGLPLLRRLLAPEIASAVLLGPAALLIVAAVPLAMLDSIEAPRNAARIEAQRDAVRQRERDELDREIAEDRVRYRNLTAASPLADYLRYAGPDDEEDMIARARLVTSRQSDAVALLETGAIRRLPWSRLDLAVTPELCTAYGAALRKLVDSDMSVPGAWYVNVTDHLEEQVPNMKWLVGGGCNLDDALSAADAPIQFFIAHKPEIEPNLPRWQALLATTAALRHR